MTHAAPQTFSLALSGLPPVLATGAWLANAVAAVRDGEARLSPVLGDLDTPEACAQHDAAVDALLDWLGTPAAIAHDLHPDFYSSRHAQQLAQRFAVPAIAVQHHHAHIAAVCAEHGVSSPVLGIALDGVGLGSDHTPWGGELLHVEDSVFERIGHFAPLALPGGDKAAREPWRLAVAVLHATGQTEEARRRYAAEPGIETVLAMLSGDIHCPRTSSAGRLFDAAAGLLGLCQRMSKDAEAARALEAAASRHIAAHGWPAALADGWAIDSAGVLDFTPLLRHLAKAPEPVDYADDQSVDHTVDHHAALFHATLVAALCAWAQHASEDTGIATVMLGGGCFYNRLLSSALPDALARHGMRVFAPERLPAGDAGLALGQAWVAAHSLMRQ